jgi:ADP-heptose:LPS heptosyltransferase
MSIIAAADYVISVDTAAFHLAGGLGKPLTGIFAWSDGKVYGKYFDFILVQKHRDNGNWDCGPCFKFNSCPKSREARKPCIEFSVDEIYSGIEKMLEKWPSATLL